MITHIIIAKNLRRQTEAKLIINLNNPTPLLLPRRTRLMVTAQNLVEKKNCDFIAIFYTYSSKPSAVLQSQEEAAGLGFLLG